jgi:hypothetical protein
MGYISNFKKFMKSEEKKTSEMGANPQKIEEEDTALLTDPDLIKIQDQKRALEKQLEAVKQQEETKLKDLRAKAAVEAQKQATAPAQPAQPATPAA